VFLQPPLPEISIRAVFKARKSQDNVEIPAMHLENIALPGEANGSQEGSDEVKHVICTLILLLRFVKDPMKTPPLGGLTGLVHQPTVV